MLFDKFDLILMSISYCRCAPADGESAAIPVISSTSDTPSHSISNPVIGEGNSPPFEETAESAIETVQNLHDMGGNKHDDQNPHVDDSEKLKNEASKQRSAEVEQFINEVSAYVKHKREEFNEKTNSWMKIHDDAMDKIKNHDAIIKSSNIQPEITAAQKFNEILLHIDYNPLCEKRNKVAKMFLDALDSNLDVKKTIENFHDDSNFSDKCRNEVDIYKTKVDALIMNYKEVVNKLIANIKKTIASFDSILEKQYNDEQKAALAAHIAELEAKEKQDQEAKEKQDQEAKEKQDQEAKEKQDQEAKEKQDQEAKTASADAEANRNQKGNLEETASTPLKGPEPVEEIEHEDSEERKQLKKLIDDTDTIVNHATSVYNNALCELNTRNIHTEWNSVKAKLGQLPEDNELYKRKSYEDEIESHTKKYFAMKASLEELKDKNKNLPVLISKLYRMFDHETGTIEEIEEKRKECESEAKFLINFANEAKKCHGEILDRKVELEKEVDKMIKLKKENEKEQEKKQTIHTEKTKSTNQTKTTHEQYPRAQNNSANRTTSSFTRVRLSSASSEAEKSEPKTSGPQQNPRNNIPGVPTAEDEKGLSPLMKILIGGGILAVFAIVIKVCTGKKNTR
ncbi:hypothetical protein ENBRE01_3172 [Enteropsectra breve]|nr:hypothetical protein ENBRE01_3172 [Enteropsectra breve]